MHEYTIPDENPHFPALLVYDDGSFTYLPGLDTWKNDLDLWFWSSIKDYLVDCRGYRFEQAGERDNEGHTVQPASWRLTGRLTDEELILLATNSDDGIPRAEWNRLPKTTPGVSVANVIFTLLQATKPFTSRTSLAKLPEIDPARLEKCRRILKP